MNRSPQFLVYKSSAGSGKTFNLAKIFLSIVLREQDPSAFRRILALTFTVKAAAEMKDRIITYLSLLAGHTTRSRADLPFMEQALIQETGLDKEALHLRSKAVLKAILHEYGDFHVMTIDKFFARMIKSFASDLALAPDFEIQIDHKQFIDRVKELLYEKIGKDDDLTELVLKLVRERLAQEKSDNSDDVIEKASYQLLNDDFHFIQDEFKHIEPARVFELKSQIDEDIQVLEEQLRLPGKMVIDALNARGLDSNGMRRGIYAFFENYASGDFTKKPMPTETQQAAISEGKWQSAKKNPALEPLIPLLEEQYARIVSQVGLISNLKFLEAIQSQLFALGFFGELQHLMEVVKAEDNVRLLSEFNTIIADRLKQEQAFFLFERLGAQFQHLLIDEFQDTSTLQWHNLLPIAENSLSEGNTTLIVGDAKQSVYRFRNSEPEQFVKLPEVAHGSQDLFAQAYQEVVLGENYRSSPQVVEFNNRFFEEMKELVLDERHRMTYAALKQRPAVSSSGSVRWWFTAPEHKRKDDVTQGMLKQVLHRIKEGVSPGDICCLFRMRTDASDFAALLLQSGVNVVSQESLLLKNNPYVSLLVDTLKAILLPNDPFIIQHWLSSYHQAKGIASYHQTAMRAKKEKFQLKDLTALLGVSLDDQDIRFGDSFTRSLAIVQALGLPMDHPFIAAFLDIALRFESTGKYLNQTFLEFWENESKSASIQLAGNRNAVSVMTIHKSKGLEFPHVMVYLPEFSSGKLTKDMAWVRVEEPISIGPTPLKLTALKDSLLDSLHEEENTKSILDSLNAIYVAFTRAKQHLEVFSKWPSSKSPLQCLTHWPEWNEEKLVLEID